MSEWRAKAAPIVRWGGVVIGLMFAVSGAWSVVGAFASFNLLSLILYIYAIVFGLLLVVAELGVWPPITVYFGFLASGSGRAWFLFFISTLCLANGIGKRSLAPSGLLLTISGGIGIALAIIGLIIRNESVVINRSPVELPGVFKGSGNAGSSSAPRATSPDTAI